MNVQEVLLLLLLIFVVVKCSPLGGSSDSRGKHYAKYSSQHDHPHGHVHQHPHRDHKRHTDWRHAHRYGGDKGGNGGYRSIRAEDWGTVEDVHGKR